jgi:hypothetical protein
MIEPPQSSPSFEDVNSQTRDESGLYDTDNESNYSDTELLNPQDFRNQPELKYRQTELLKDAHAQLQLRTFCSDAIRAAQALEFIPENSTRMRMESLVLVLCNGDLGYNPERLSEVRLLDELVTILQSVYSADRYAEHYLSESKSNTCRKHSL